MYKRQLQQGTIEGVLVIASFDEKQQKLLISKQEQLMEYLEKISGLISAKLEQEALMERTQIMNAQMSLSLIHI